tara:strand:- start:636 stop:893 length:258 start_codon:yes stop_codon:yes gene_type:complete
LVDHVLNEDIDLLGFNGAFLAGSAEAVYNFGFVEVFSASVAFGDVEAFAKDLFVGGVAIPAGCAFSTASDCRPVFANAGIDDFVV